MGHPTKMRAASAASADEAEGAAGDFALASVRPSPLPEASRTASTGTEPTSNANDTASLDRLDVAGRMTVLREAFERHARSDKSKADRRSTGGTICLVSRS